jgi:hypothetical protein
MITTTGKSPLTCFSLLISEYAAMIAHVAYGGHQTYGGKDKYDAKHLSGAQKSTTPCVAA